VDGGGREECKEVRELRVFPKGRGARIQLNPVQTACRGKINNLWIRNLPGEKSA